MDEYGQILASNLDNINALLDLQESQGNYDGITVKVGDRYVTLKRENTRSANGELHEVTSVIDEMKEMAKD